MDTLNQFRETRERIIELARTLPSLTAAEGVYPWDAGRFNKWARAQPLNSAERHAACFLLSVVDPATRSCGRFDCMAALKVWTPAERAAFLAWAQKPWWL